jgi:hypothetical protein
MKKITLVFILCLTMVTWSYGQCTDPVYQFPTSTVEIGGDLPGLQTITTQNWPQNEFSVLNGLVIGNSYTVTATADITDPDTEPNPMTYITITSDGTAVIASGFDSVSFVASTVGITIYWTLDAACTNGPNRDTLTEIECTTCTCTETAVPACATEIAPADGDTSAATGLGGADGVTPTVSFEWVTDPTVISYELFINGFSQGARQSGITFSGLPYDTAFTWSLIPTNCFGVATGCDTWAFTTETEEEALSIDEVENENSVSHFYNTNTNELTLKSASLPFKNIELYNILGKRVLNQKLSQTNETLNLTTLTDGIYIGKISIEGRTQTIKILKQ